MNNRKVINNSCYNAFPSFSLLAQRKFAASEQKRTCSFFRARANFTEGNRAKRKGVCGGGKKSFPSRRPAGGTTQSTMQANAEAKRAWTMLSCEEKKMRSILTYSIVLSPQPCYGRRIFSFTPHVAFTSLQPTGSTTDIFYYHMNHLGSTAFVTDQNQNITQGFLYAPFGEITTEYNATFGNDIIPKYSFNAKELDEETGMYYYEARYYKPPVFTSRDPMFEKYFWMTPYAYCANNPVKYVDPDGKKVVINGDEQEAAFDEFKKGAARYGIKVKMNKHGVIRGRRYFGKSLSPEGEQILHAIRDKRINVNINATSSNTTEGDKPFFGGAFLGNTLSLVKNNKDGVAKYRVNTKQDVNPSDLKALSDYYGMPGQDMLHEVTESYEGGLLALERKESINNSLADISSFQIVHQRAIPQSGGYDQDNKYHPENKKHIGYIWSIGSYRKVWVLPQYRSLITNP